MYIVLTFIRIIYIYIYIYIEREREREREREIFDLLLWGVGIAAINHFSVSHSKKDHQENNCMNYGPNRNFCY